MSEAEVPPPGLPPITKYDFTVAGDAYKSNSVFQDDDGIMYFGTLPVVTAYDGETWRQIRRADNSEAFLSYQMARGPDNRIYIVALHDFGYLAPDAQGQMQFVSLLEQAPAEHREITSTSALANVHVIDQVIYFRFETKLFRWQPATQAIQVWAPEGGLFNNAWEINGQYYVHQSNQGLLRIAGDNLEQMPGGERFIDEFLWFVLPYDANRMLLGAQQGLSLYDGERFQPFGQDLGPLTRTSSWASVALPNGNFAIGTTNQGVLIIDRQGRLQQQLNHDAGLTNNLIWDLHVSPDGALWVAGEDITARVEVNAPFSHYDARNGEAWSTRSTYHQGVFYTAATSDIGYWDTASQSFQRMGVNCGEIFQLREIDEQLIATCTFGNFRLQNKQAIPMSRDEVGPYPLHDIHPARRDDTRLFGTTLQGVTMIRRQPDGRWQAEDQLPEFEAPVWQIAEDDQHRLWLSGSTLVVYQLSFPHWPQLDEPVIKTFALPQENIPVDFWEHYVKIIDNQLFSMSHAGLFKWNEAAQQFERELRFGPEAAFLTLDQADRLWVQSARFLNTALAVPQNDGTYFIDSDGFKPLADKWISSIRADLVHDLTLTWFGTQNSGLIRYDDRRIKSATSRPFKVMLRQIRQDATLLYGGSGPLVNNHLTFAHNENGFRFEYAAPFTGHEKDTRYQTRLTGFDNDWSDWKKTANIRYTNLSPGNYQFQVKAQNVYVQESDSEIFVFTISAPWYQRPWAYLLYALVAVIVFVGVLRGWTARIRQQRDALELVVEERTRDISEARDKAEQANRAKSTFLANMSHELRTPLNAILGFTQLMQRDARMPEEQANNLGIVNRSGEHLLSLINDVLDMAKIEAGRTELMLEPFDLYRLLDSLEDMLRVRAESKQIKLLFEVSELPNYVIADESKLRQILINLMGNAIKFTDAGSVKLRASSPQENRLAFEIADTGAGIATDELDKLFKAFAQTESGEQSKEGTGLGLAISRQFVQMMDGDITVESTPGQGSVFRFKVNVDPATAADLQADAAPQRVLGLAEGQDSKRILVVDDRFENRSLLTQLLNEVGFEAVQAANGQEAIEQWQSWSPDLIFMDMRMPVMNGYDATKYITTQAGPPTIVIALTASAFEEDRGRVLEAGCADFMRKPFKEHEIFEAIAKHLDVAYRYEDTTGQPTETSDKPLTKEDLAILPEAWQQAFREAVMAAKLDASREQIALIADEHPQLAAQLNMLVEQFRFDILMELTVSELDG
ncbi:MAG: ATP-binding protein [Pseudomonadota bacterium]